MKNNLEDYEVRDLLDKLVAAAEHKAEMQIAASSCQTSRDWAKAQEAEQAYYEVREAVEKALGVGVFIA